jgi:hypothetical protein
MSNVPPLGRRPLVYLACPYGHHSAIIREQRFRIVSVVAARMTLLGYNVFSPISHSHPLFTVENMPADWSFWEKVDMVYLELSRKLVVLQLDGWAESIGVAAEMKRAHELDIPIIYLNPVYSNSIASETMLNNIRKIIGD